MKVRIYVEGGPVGADADGVRLFRIAFRRHLQQVDPGLKALDVIACGSTDQTIKIFANAIRKFPADFIVSLLVDSDAPVTADSPAKHLENKLNSANVPKNARANIFLMVQCMEAWLVTDVAALEKCSGNRLRANALPSNPDIEAVSKSDVLAALNAAVKLTPSGRFHKVEHGAKVLANLNPDRVGARSRHARSLHAFLRSSMQT